MTTFNKELFTWDGMYLTYQGAFIVRFKYGSKPWKSFRNFLVKNFTVEEYLKLAEATSPMEAVEVKGYGSKV